MSGSKYIRNAEGHFVCPHCDKVTEKQNTMYYHIKKIHTQDLPFQCKLCTDTPRFLQKSSYLHHLATHHPESCTPEECGGTNPYAGVKFTCPCCTHSTHTKANLLIHYARTHCKDWIPGFTKSESGNCGCKSCDKTFNSSSAYLYHAVGCMIDSAPEAHAANISRIK